MLSGFFIVIQKFPNALIFLSLAVLFLLLLTSVAFFLGNMIPCVAWNFYHVIAFSIVCFYYGISICHGLWRVGGLLCVCVCNFIFVSAWVVLLGAPEL